jgi:tRNA (adenine57-N1/adenine58-N1)-methyltransferase
VLASFSPCVEQVQRTCRALADAGFGPPATHELLLREHRVAREALVTDVLGREGKGGSGAGGGGAKRGRGADDAGKTVVARPMDVARGHTGYLTFARRAVD